MGTLCIFRVLSLLNPVREIDRGICACLPTVVQMYFPVWLARMILNMTLTRLFNPFSLGSTSILTCGIGAKAKLLSAWLCCRSWKDPELASKFCDLLDVHTLIPTMAGPTKTEPKPAEKKGPAVIGINFGNAYASIAVINNVSL